MLRDYFKFKRDTSDGKTTKRVQNATPILVNWKDTSNVNAKIKISLATPNDTANVILKKGIVRGIKQIVHKHKYINN